MNHGAGNEPQIVCKLKRAGVEVRYERLFRVPRAAVALAAVAAVAFSAAVVDDLDGSNHSNVL